MGIKKKKPVTNLAAGRPPTVKRPKSISRKATKALINKHHLLEKKRDQAISRRDKAEADKIDAEISSLGGLERYQQASLQGQRIDRGGDSSRVLMTWLESCLPALQGMSESPLRMLEVGALSTENSCSASGCFDIERIDLHSQGDGILEQDFMERPLPKADSERFDIISLSLVLNFVPDPQGRGEMLRRTLQFLYEPEKRPSSPSAFFPSLFLVLPAPCVTNSRYLDAEKLARIMTSLGYSEVASKTTQRLVYYLWRRDIKLTPTQTTFAKPVIRSGGSRNNFAIVLN